MQSGQNATVPAGVPELGNLPFEGSVLDNSDVPALLGLRTIEALHGIMDTRVNRRNMYICDNPEDILITVRPGARCVHVQQLVVSSI
eukprot:956602-Prorocentrum_lima.AAC.1